MSDTHQIMCELSPCGLPAFARVTWSSELMGTQSANLCRPHSDDMWNRYKGAISSGLITYTIEKQSVKLNGD